MQDIDIFREEQSKLTRETQTLLETKLNILKELKEECSRVTTQFFELQAEIDCKRKELRVKQVEIERLEKTKAQLCKKNSEYEDILG